VLNVFSKLATHNNARNFRNFVATLVCMVVGHFSLWARSLKVLKFQEILGNFYCYCQSEKIAQKIKIKIKIDQENV